MENKQNEWNEVLRVIIDHKKKIKTLESELKLEKRCLSDVEDFMISELSVAGISSFKNKEGVSVSVQPKKKFSILVKDKENINQWLIEKGFKHLIKTEVNSTTLNAFFNNDWIDEEGKEKPRPEFVNKYEFNKLKV